MPPHYSTMSRRNFLQHSAVGLGAAGVLGALESPATAESDGSPFQPNYVLASCMYGELPLAEIVPAVVETGAKTLDIWPRKHGNQREQLDEMGEDAFMALLESHGVALGIITRYDLGPFKLQEELKVLKRLGGKFIVTGSGGGAGNGLKADMAHFLEQMKPHVAAAEDLGVSIAIENHANSLMDPPDALKYFAELNTSPHLGLAYAPYHLPQDTAVQAELIEACGPAIMHYYAWEHGHGCHDPLPKALEMQQLPGYGPFDFTSQLAALKKIEYGGWVSIFMHPVPRGIPILPTAEATTAAINRSREYLDYCAKQL